MEGYVSEERIHRHLNPNGVPRTLRNHFGSHQIGLDALPVSYLQTHGRHWDKSEATLLVQ